MIKKILITGGAGYIGSQITELLLEKILKCMLLIIFQEDLESL